MSRKLTARRQELREIVAWLIEHKDFSGLGQIIAEHIHDGSGHKLGAPFLGDLFIVIAKHTRPELLDAFVTSAKTCKTQIEQIERIRQASKLLGLDYEDVEKLVERVAA